MADPIIVVDYDPTWPERFQFLHRRIAGALGNVAVAIEHVGSTAVPNLAAKPIIDIDVLLANENALPTVIGHLAKLGYVHQGTLGIPDREAFLAPVHDIPHHLYVCPQDYLRAHAQEVNMYGETEESTRFAVP